MATVAMQPAEAATLQYRSALSSGVRAIAIVAGLIVAWALLAFVALGPAVGVAGLAVAAAVALLDAEFGTPTQLAITDQGVTIGWWHRERTYPSSGVVVQHDVRRDRFTITRRGRGSRVLARFRSDDGPAIARALVAAGVEVSSI